MTADEDYTEPWPAHFAGFIELPDDYPIDLLNLVLYRDRALYPADHPQAQAGLTGAEAFRIYTEQSFPSFVAAGGEIVWAGRMEGMLIGPITESWSAAFVARYPSATAFLKSVAHPDYKSAVIHRQAALKTSRLIRLKPFDPARAGG